MSFPLRDATKASLYRNEVTAAAVRAVPRGGRTLFSDGGYSPVYSDSSADPSIRGRLRPLMQQADRAIDWRRDDSATVLRKIRSADGFPGVRDRCAAVSCSCTTPIRKAVAGGRVS